MIEQFHKEFPASAGPSPLEVRNGMDVRLPPSVVSAILDVLVDEGRAVRSGSRIGMPWFEPRVVDEQIALSQQVMSALQTDDRHAPRVSELAASLRIDAADIKQTLRHAAQRRLVVELSEDRYLLTEQARTLASAAKALADASPKQAFSVREFSDRAGIGRNLAIQILEHFDRAGLTRRVGDARQIMQSVDSAFGGL